MARTSGAHSTSKRTGRTSDRHSARTGNKQPWRIDATEVPNTFGGPKALTAIISNAPLFK